MTASLRLPEERVRQLRLGQRVRQLREDRHITGAALARACGITRQAVNQIERGIGGSDETLAKIAEALQVPVAALYEEPAVAGPSGKAAALETNVLIVIADAGWTP